MKKNLFNKSLIVGAVAVVFGVLSALPSLSWYHDDTYSNLHIDGNVHGSYFESGDGTVEHPFEIAKPIQLYYLSWLQEMGYFNEVATDNSGNPVSPYTLKRQYNFFLSADIDMNVIFQDNTSKQYELPPIGTFEYPFVGSFDGNGHTISNLRITNDIRSYTDDPHQSKVNDPSASYEILGLFGVLGTTNTGTASNTVNCSLISSNGDISQLESDAIFTPSQNYIKDFYINDVLIVASTDSDNALVGAVAGYANANISGVGVRTANFSVKGSRGPVTSIVGTEDNSVLSNYTSVGYATEGHKRDIGIYDTEVYKPQATAKTYVANSSGDSWGGSINMPALRKRIYSSKNMKVNTFNIDGTLNRTNQTQPTNTVYPYNNRETYVDGQLVGETKSTNSGNILSGETKNTMYYYSDKNAYNNNSEGKTGTVGSYYYVQQGSSGDGLKAYLGGYSDIGASTVKNVTKITNSGTTENGYRIKTSSANNSYIAIDESADSFVSTSKGQNEATIWLFGNDSLYARKTVNGHDTVYFLNLENGNYKVERSANTKWEKTNNSFKGSATKKFWIRQSSSGNHYLKGNLNNNTLSISDATDKASGSIWNLDIQNSANSKGTISTTIKGNSYYLNVNANQDDNSVRLHISPDDEWTQSAAITNNSGQNVSFVSMTRYLRYSNGWKLNSSSTNVYVMKDTTTKENITCETVNNQASFSYEFSWERSGQPGYVPLSAGGDTSLSNYNESAAVDIKNYYATESNTGYVVGGFYDRNNGNKSSYPSTHGSNFGDVRISQYKMNKISGSFSTGNGGTFSTLYTIKDDKDHDPYLQSFTQNNVDGQNFVKFNDSIVTLKENLMSDTSFVSGIHFMDSSINMDNIITADHVFINGKVIDDYEMPEDSIDFTLKEKGYINFFAGNYHNDNDSFFALHKIERDSSNKIISMKKIYLVFSNKNDSDANYIYLYSDGTWSDSSVNINVLNGQHQIDQTAINNLKTYGIDDNYKFSFDTNWIGINSSLVPRGNTGDGNRIYYFEIPVNSGEYALGSCEGGCGGYLIYLDISAAAQNINRVTLYEMYIKETFNSEIPNGIQYVQTIPEANTENNGTALDVRDMSSINDLESYCGYIESTNTDETYSTYISNNEIASNNTSLVTTYVGDGIDDNDTLTGRQRCIVRKITDYDYNIVTRVYVKQVTIVETTQKVEGNNTVDENHVTTSISYNKTGFDSEYTPVITFNYTYSGSANFIYNYYLIASEFTKRIEINFFTSREDLAIKVQELNNDFSLTCGIGSDTYTSENIDPSTSISCPKATTIPDGTIFDSYLAFDDDNKLIAFHYITQGDEQIAELFEFTNFSDSFNIPSNYQYQKNVETSINDSYFTGYYTFYFVLENSDSSEEGQYHVHVWYVWIAKDHGSNSFDEGEDSDYIHFIPPTNGKYVEIN